MNFLLLAAINGTDAIHQLLVLLIIGIVLGIILWLVNIAPFIPAPFKQVLQWLIYGIGALIVINFLLGLVGHPMVTI